MHSLYASNFIQAIPHISDFEETASESGTSQFSLHHQQLHSLNKRKKAKTINKQVEDSNDNNARQSYKKRGSRVRRRLESVAFIESYAHLLTIEEEDIGLITNESNPLGQLFEDSSAMQTWQEFIQLNEVEQDLLLDTTYSGSNSTFDDDWVDIYSVVYPKKKFQEKNNTKKLQSKTCNFCKNDHCGGYWSLHDRYRRLLSRRHIPLGWICGIEDCLRDHFSEKITNNYSSSSEMELELNDFVLTPSLVWQQEEKDSFRRLFIHLVAQYLGLLSMSQYSEIKNPMVIVENRSVYFSPPCKRLNEFLESHKLYD